jgi:hypothetical protein
LGWANLPSTTDFSLTFNSSAVGSSYGSAARVSDFDRGGPNDYYYLCIWADDGSQWWVFNASFSGGALYTSDNKQSAYTIALAGDGTSFLAVGMRSTHHVWIYPLHANYLPDNSERMLLPIGTGLTGNGTYRVRQVKFDAAYNLYVTQDGFGALRVYSPGGASIATTSGDTNSATSSTFNLQLGPAINPQPISQTKPAGFTTLFSSGAHGTPPLSYQWVKNGTNFLVDTPPYISGATSNSLWIYNSRCINDAGSYQLIVSNAVGAVTSAVATLTVNEPYIASRPLNQTNNFDSTATFTVSPVFGSPPFAYRWRRDTNDLSDDGSHFFGTTNDTLYIYNVSQADATNGGYSVVVTSACGALTSRVATLTVIDPPVITNHPQGQVVTLGSNATFTAMVDGTPPFTYNWYFTSGWIDGGTATSNTISYTVVNAQPANAGDYYVDVSNPAGGPVTSSNAHLTVLPPQPTIQPLVGASTTNVLISWDTVSGFNYELQYNTNLATTNWALLTNFLATDISFSFTNTPAGGRQRYYRLLAW